MGIKLDDIAEKAYEECMRASGIPRLMFSNPVSIVYVETVAVPNTDSFDLELKIVQCDTWDEVLKIQNDPDFTDNTFKKRRWIPSIGDAIQQVIARTLATLGFLEPINDDTTALSETYPDNDSGDSE